MIFTTSFPWIEPVSSVQPPTQQLSEFPAALISCAYVNQSNCRHNAHRCCLLADLMFCFAEQMTTESVLDVLCVADMYLLAGLKRLCGKTLGKTICEENVLYLWKTAKLFRLSRLEDQCTEFMAKIIDRVSAYICFFFISI